MGIGNKGTMNTSLISGIRKTFRALRTIIYAENHQSLVARLESATVKEETKATDLQKVLEAKQKLAKARAKTQQIMRDIDAVASGNGKEAKV